MQMIYAPTDRAHLVYNYSCSVLYAYGMYHMRMLYTIRVRYDHRVSAGIMGHVSVMHVISTVTYYALTSELWLPETFVITLSVKVVPEMQLILLLEWKSHKFTPCCTNYEACHVWDL